MSFYKLLIRPLLFTIDPEKAHKSVFGFIKFLFAIPGIKSLTRSIYVVRDKRLHRKIFGIDFPNPVGLAAGFDKDAQLFNELDAFDFGFIEVGTVTPLPQDGNPVPRMFRLTDDDALINRMGFNNRGVKAMTIELKQKRPGLIVGANIGKNKNTPNENSIRDYEICFRELYNSVDYFALNVSSPNTPGLRSLQEKEPLMKLLSFIQKVNKELSFTNTGRLKPVLLKIAPDLSDGQLDDVVEVVVASGLDGIIAVNTTLSRDNLFSPQKIVSETGGLSGKPLNHRSTEVIRYLKGKSQNRFHIIGVGGIHSPDDAIEKLKAGADLVQIYTGFIYEGPSLVKKINKKILDDPGLLKSAIANR